MPFNNKKSMWNVLPVLIACSFSLLASANENSLDHPFFEVKGFGTIGAVYHDKPGVGFRREDSQPEGAQGKHLDFDPDSTLGLRLEANISPRVSAAVQLVTRQTWEDNYKPQMTWAYLKFLPSDALSVRIGRLGIDTFLHGDAVDVDFGNLMVRPQFVFHPHSFDGVDAEHIMPVWEDGLLRLKGHAGFEYDKRVNIGGSVYDFSGARVLGVAAELEKEGWTGRLAVGQIKFNKLDDGLYPGQPLHTALSFLPNGDDVIERMSVRDRTMQYEIMALSYDRDAWQGAATYGRMHSDGWPTRHVFFANLGYRIEEFTPYAGFSIQHTPRNLIPSGFPVPTLPGQVSDLAQAGLLFNQQDLAVGIRYDFAPNKALKLQFDHIRYRDPDGILDPSLVSLSSSVAERDYRTMTMLSLAFNFVF